MEDQEVQLPSIPSEEAFGTLDIHTGLVRTDGIPSEEEFGVHTIELSILAIGIPSDEAFGVLEIHTGLVRPDGLQSGEEFGIFTTMMHVSPTGIPSREVLGQPKSNIHAHPEGIASAEAISNFMAHFTAFPAGVPSAEAFGTPVTNVPISDVGGIPSEEVFGSPIYVYYDERVRNITLQPSTVRLEAGNSVVILGRVNPAGIDDRIDWSTSNYEVASAIGTGLTATVRAHSEGTVSIMARSPYDPQNVYAVCEVLVTEKYVVVYEALKILSPNFGEIKTLNNTEIVDLTISKELSGHHGVEFVLPVGADGWDQIKRGRYVETEEQKYTIETIRPARGNDDIPLLSVSCTHVFFEIDRDNMPHDTSARATILEHLSYVLRGTGVTVIATAQDNAFYSIEREIGYSADETKFKAFKKVFAVFGGFYRLDQFMVEVIPPRPPLPVSAVVLEYAVTNESIEKLEDDTDVVTVLYAKGGNDLTRTVRADAEIRALYRRDRVRFVNFGDIRLWNNFVYVTDQYIEKRQLPRTTYTLSVAELKQINGIEELYPARDFEINVGKVVQVKDTELGIDAHKLIQRYLYKPLAPESVSQVVVGDKPLDIMFEEVSREGIVGEEEGEWRYDEGTEEWVFFPDDPDYGDDDIGIDYKLEIDEHPASVGPVALRYRYHTGTNAYEVSTLTITGTAEISGNVTVILDGELYSVRIEEEDEPEQIAAKIAARTYPRWTALLNGEQVVFTATKYGAKRYSAEYKFGLTGAVGGFQTIKGREAAYTSDWRGASLPFENWFSEGDVVEVKAESSSKWYSLVEWTGDGSGLEPREFVMTTNRSAQVRFASTAPMPKVASRTPSNFSETSVILNGEVYELGKFSSVNRGFVWAFHANPTLEDNEGNISAGSGGLGVFSESLAKDTTKPPGTRYYYRAYLQVYDNEDQKTITHLGTTISLAFPEPDQFEVSISVNALDGAPITDYIEVSPYVGSEFHDENATVELNITDPILAGLYEFKHWIITNEATSVSQQVTDRPYNLTVDANYAVVCYVDRPRFTLTLLQDNGTGSIQWAIGEGYPRTIKRLQTQLIGVTHDVYVWVIPDPQTSEEFEWEGPGEGSEPRLFKVEDGHQTATVIFDPKLKCKTRCIFISAEPPDPETGQDGDVWLQYEE